MSLKYGFVFPFLDARTIAELAAEAEAIGWDGVFVSDGVWGTDPWVTLAAVAMVTNRIRIGTMITPVSRRRPWKLASEASTLDNLSQGRVVLPVGLGALDTGFGNFGEQTDRKIRAELLDEGLDIITGLWKGQPFNFDGKHFHIRETTFFPPPPPLQSPRIPIWVVGAWPHKKSMQRVIRYDGLLPAKMNPDRSFAEVTPYDVRAMKKHIDEHRTLTTPFDVVMDGQTVASEHQQTVDKIAPYAEVGATWWVETMWFPPNGAEEIAKRIRQGPPRID